MDMTKVNNFMSKLSKDELYLFEADLEDAIDGVLEDWSDK